MKKLIIAIGLAFLLSGCVMPIGGPGGGFHAPHMAGPAPHFHP